jgi:D-alanyl-D-alanine carboxypeptidase/D-alanyl-D-alanine-endopeptidase (penicillin-binding protein 4)
MICRAGSRRPVTSILAPALALSLGAATLLAQQRPRQASEAPASSRIVTLQRDIDATLARPSLQRASWGVLVRSLSSNETLYSLNAERLLIPASNMKIVTLAAAAARLGWDFAFDTRLVAAGPVANGTLDGDLVVVGSGDPSIDDWDGAGSRLFAEWAETLKQSGIERITGRIVGDDNSFDDDSWGAGWAWDDLDRSFATGVGTLQFNQNSAQITLTAGTHAGDPPEAVLSPAGSGLMIRNRMLTGEPGSPASLTFRRLIDSPTIELRGSFPAGSKPVVRNIAVQNPTLYFTRALRDALIRSGITVEGEAVDIDDIDNAPPRARGTVVVTHRSEPLPVLATTMMQLSQNLYAETLLKAIGAQHEVGSAASGRASVMSLLEEWGLPATDVRIADGSGLSTYDLVTPSLLVGILTHVAQDPVSRSYFQSALPVAGKDGTLAQRMKGTPAEGNVRAKTGSLSNARAMSGYLTTRDGEPLAFSIIANNFNGAVDDVDDAIDAVVTRLVRVSRK